MLATALDTRGPSERWRRRMVSELLRSTKMEKGMEMGEKDGFSNLCARVATILATV
jgi:hypothetical protein